MWFLQDEYVGWALNLALNLAGPKSRLGHYFPNFVRTVRLDATSFALPLLFRDVFNGNKP